MGISFQKGMPDLYHGFQHGGSRSVQQFPQVRQGLPAYTGLFLQTHG